MKITTQTAKTRDAIIAAVPTNDRDLHQFADQSAKKVAIAAAIDPFIARVEQLRADRQRVKDVCLAADDVRTWASLDRNDLTELELHGKFAGRLDGPRETVQNNVHIMLSIPRAEDDEPRLPPAIDVTAGE